MSILVFQVVIYKVHTFIAYIHTGCLVVRGKNTSKHVEAGASEIILNTSKHRHGWDEHQNGEERWFKWLWKWHGCWCQTRWSEHLRVCRAWNGLKKENIRWFPCVKMPSWCKTSTVTQRLTPYNQDLLKSTSECTALQNMKQMRTRRRPHQVPSWLLITYIPLMTTVYLISWQLFPAGWHAMSESSNHFKLVSWTWRCVHCAQMASRVTRYQSSRAPLGS